MDYAEKYDQLLFEFENYKRRTEKELQNIHSPLLVQMIPIMDHLDLIKKNMATDTPQGLLKNLDAVHEKIKRLVNWPAFLR